MTFRSVVNPFALVAALLLSSTANAQLFRAYVASDGSDANACTLPAPCRLLPAALAAVAGGGEIWMLDSANYNTATLTVGKSVSILAVPGAVGSVVALGGPAISIAASGLNVSLRNLVIVPLPASGATHGISMTGASALTIEHSLIANLPNDAVYVLGAGTLKIANTIIRNNGGYAANLNNGAAAEISGTQMLANAAGGILAYSSGAGTTRASVSDSIVSGGNLGVLAKAMITGAFASIFVTRCTIEKVTYALSSETGPGDGNGAATVSISSSMITNNDYGWIVASVFGRRVESLGNNHFAGNANYAGFLTPMALQ